MRLEQGIVTAAGTLSPGVAIYDGFAPQGVALPYVTFQRISTTRGETMTTPDTLTRVRVQFDAWAETIAAAQSMAEALRTLIDGHSGSFGGVTVQYARLAGEHTAFLLDGDTRTRRVSLDFEFVLHE